ncbi:MAG: hypothetical protein R3F56_07360 [Planctomycetota bacterium]
MHVPLVLPLLLLATLSAQPDYPLLRTSPGVIGQTFTLDYSNASGGAFVLLIASATNGPTPLALLSPADPRVLEVGLDLPALWLAQPTGSGSGTFAYATPNAPNLHGLTLQFQSCTLPGSTFFVGAISSVAAVQLGVGGTAAPLAASFAGARTLATVTDVDAATHEVLVAGGGVGSLLGAVGLDTTEIVDTQRLTARPGPRLTTARALAAAVTLADGKTLICGGVDAAGSVLASAEVYDPATHTTTAVANMATARALHAAARLSDGRVLVVGGTTSLADPISALSNAQNTAEIFDPTTRTWASARAMGRRLLAPGLHAVGARTLVSGGFEVTIVFGIPIPIGAVPNCQTYDSAANTWSNAASMRVARAAHHTSAAYLANGDLVFAGGATSGPDLTQASAIANAEAYTPATNTWTALPNLAQARVGHSAALLGGRIVVAGGTQGTLTAPTPITSVEAFVPNSLAWTTLPPLGAARGGHAAALTADGLWLLCGGQGAASTLGSIETLR